MYTALADTSETVRQLIFDDLKADVGTSGLAAFMAGGARGVSLATPTEMTRNQAGQGVKEGVSLWLYRVLRDEQRLNDPPTLRSAGGGRVDITPPPLPLRLHYLITPLAQNNSATEQKLLGRILQLFHTRPIISGTLLKGDLAGTPAKLHIRLEPLSLEEITRVWDALQGSYQLSVSYEVSIANLESRAESQNASLVESARAELALVNARRRAP